MKFCLKNMKCEKSKLTKKQFRRCLFNGHLSTMGEVSPQRWTGEVHGAHCAELERCPLWTGFRCEEVRVVEKCPL